MAYAAHASKIEYSADGITWYEIDGINDASFEVSRDVLETTDFKDTSGAKTRIMGLQDTSLSIKGDYEDTDTNGQNAIRTAFLNGTAVYMGFKLDGTDGYKVQCYCTKFSTSVSVDGKVEFEAEFISTGAVATHS